MAINIYFKNLQQNLVDTEHEHKIHKIVLNYEMNVFFLRVILHWCFWMSLPDKHDYKRFKNIQYSFL